MFDDYRIQRFWGIGGTNFTRDMNCQCLVYIFVHYGEHFARAVITQLIMYKINCPNMVGCIGPHEGD